ncbi:hypothetical protein PR202_gb12430 [Eleusine coracana subsp. coracana]|uniref:Bifunctional inhibitor/plant lipid transfer protein/seed storage helical domain-containing protein n=1 Tax=Eleusine coracana subsp. coracana TaxID=191504 RepID=A0AAV5ERC6_ELECO|nr:hypothetical protein PR202_gb12430 [Eleusine coracana subsp. coracana]
MRMETMMLHVAVMIYGAYDLAGVRAGATGGVVHDVAAHQLHPMLQLPHQQLQRCRPDGRLLAALMNASTGCACLVLTGNVPLAGVPIDRTLAVTLPKACNSMAVPVQCRDTSTQTPAPGPVAVTPPSTPPLPPSTPATPESEAPVHPRLLPSSAWRTSSRVSRPAVFVLLLAVGAALV